MNNFIISFKLIVNLTPGRLLYYTEIAPTIQITPWFMEPGGLIMHLQGLSNNSYADPNPSNISY